MAQQQQEKTSPLLKGGQGQLVPQPINKETINAYYGGNGGPFQVNAGQSLKDILATSEIRDSCGYTNLQDANTIVCLDGQEIARKDWDKTIVKEGQTVEVLKRAGSKA
jgi:sulfur carrier protein ThiS